MGITTTGMSPILSGFASNDLNSRGKPERIAAAAREFEAVLIEQMLKEVRAGSGLGEESDQATSTLREIADQQFSRLIAGQGGFGISRMLLKSFEPTGSPAPEEGAATRSEAEARLRR